MKSVVFTPSFRPDPKPAPKEKKPYAGLPKRKPTGEAVLFKAIWNSRPHVSFVSGEKLGNDAYPWMFGHVLSKAKNRFPHYILLAENIVLLTEVEHFMWDKNREACKLLPEFKKLFELEAVLKAQYEKDFKSK